MDAQETFALAFARVGDRRGNPIFLTAAAQPFQKQRPC